MLRYSYYTINKKISINGDDERIYFITRDKQELTPLDDLTVIILDSYH